MSKERKALALAVDALRKTWDAGCCCTEKEHDPDCAITACQMALTEVATLVDVDSLAADPEQAPDFDSFVRFDGEWWGIDYIDAVEGEAEATAYITRLAPRSSIDTSTESQPEED